jgi:aryl-alcohol dehydrogenase-like predicted oxidoreductase
LWFEIYVLGKEIIKMRYKLLGNSGLRVSELALGTMTFGEDWGWGASKEVSKMIFDTFAEAGGNFIDTAVNYTNNTSEKFVGEFIKANRDYFVVATKYTLREDPEHYHDPNAGGNQRKNMMRSVEKSLRSLGTGYIDLLWLHIWDFMTPIDEVMRGLNDLVSSGKVLYAGISDTPAWVIAKANSLASSRGWIQPIAIQVPYNLARRDVELELFPMARHEGLSATVWGILGGGVLTGKYRNEGEKRYEQADPRSLEIGDAVVRISEEIGCSPSQVALNWLRQRPWQGPPIIPILGVRNFQQLHDNLGALEFKLSKEQIKQLDELSPPTRLFPSSMIQSDEVKRIVYGETYDLVDNHRRYD